MIEQLYKSKVTGRILRDHPSLSQTYEVVSDPSETDNTVGHPLPWPFFLNSLVPLTEQEFRERWGDNQGYQRWLALNGLEIKGYNHDNDGNTLDPDWEPQWMGPGSDYDDMYNNPDVACGAD